ncbi:hypothetical protein OIO90_005138 [Microbotryomycetes sp. JL221]|nr:hypothetical protein OIO90_005138 [Microbotryomycetes sp. JL221]
MTDTPRGAATPPGSGAGSLSERRRSDSTATNPPTLTGLSTKQASSVQAPQKQSREATPRDADAPTLNVVQGELPDMTTPLASAAATPLATGTAPAAGTAKVGRSGTIKRAGAPTSTSSITQPKPGPRRQSEGGYDGEIERHGQANDFVDSDDEHSANGNSRNGNKQTYEFPREDLNRSTRRNFNPSSSCHSHPGRLPFNARTQSFRQNGDGPRSRTASLSSTRSFEATNHPFPTPGQKFTKTQPFADWKSVEEKRLEEDEKKEKHWKRWGPYLSERQWATVREDYSANGDAWSHFPHEHARSRAYRWGEDGIGGLSDNHGKMCLSFALWNGVDPILKERLFGVTGHQGNHGEDVKELYWYLDSTPTHSYMKMLYKYPQREFPYERLVRENQMRDRNVDEFEITDTDLFDDNRYWDIFIEYAKDEDLAEGISVRITAYNRGPEAADLHIIPQLWFRNTWSWPKERPQGPKMPSLKQVGEGVVQADEEHLGRYYFHAVSSPAPVNPRSKGDEETVFTDEIVTPELLFTENDTNFERLYGGKNAAPYVKDAFHDHIIPKHRMPLPKVAQQSTPRPDVHSDGETTPNGERAEPEYVDQEDTRQYVNPEKTGTKVGAHYTFTNVPANGGCAVVRLKLTTRTAEEDSSIQDEESFDWTIEERRHDSDEFYSRFNSGALSDDLRNIMRQALSGMLWTKQFYMFIQKEWIEGDPGQPAPPPERKWIRNREWKHLHIEDILSMPDKWEYPFFAIWDSAFHCIPLAMVDPAYAKKQLDIMTREWYMKPDGALPAYEWNFGDVNPPVHAWATFRVFKLERKMYGREDLQFLERVFQKLMLNFTWWVNRKDSGGNNVFEGGFLGLDNISPFNRSERLPTGGTMHQADGTGWMAFYCLCMLNIALELAKHNPVYEDIASKFFEHYLYISDAMTFHDGDNEQSLWNEEEGFYFDAISWGPGEIKQLPIKSLVGLIPLYATLTLEPALLKKFPGFAKRMQWFIDNRPSMAQRNIANMSLGGKGDRRLLALASEDRLRLILKRMLDEDEFLSDFGIRSLSRYHKENPWSMNVNGEEFSVHFWPGDSRSGMFGGNSNWRGPIWLATTFLLIESLQRFYQYHGHKFKVECPTGSGDEMNLANVADEIQHRIIHIFARDNEGNRACNGGSDKLNRDPHFRDYVPFHEFFNCETGKGLGASHQTGWTGLIAYFIWSVGASARLPRTPRTPRSAAAHYFDETVPHTPGATDYEYSDAQTPYMSAAEDGDAQGGHESAPEPYDL